MEKRGKSQILAIAPFATLVFPIAEEQIHQEDPKGCRGLQRAGGRSGVPGEALCGFRAAPPGDDAGRGDGGACPHQVSAIPSGPKHQGSHDTDASGSRLPTLCLSLPRFLFILLGPAGKAKSYNEIGRAIATLMVDDVSRCNTRPSLGTPLLRAKKKKAIFILMPK